MSYMKIMLRISNRVPHTSYLAPVFGNAFAKAMGISLSSKLMKMKKIIFSLLALFFMTGLANAQAKQGMDNTKTKQTQNQKKQYGAKQKPYSTKNKKAKNSNWDSINRTGRTDTTNNSNLYKSKATGQTATPSGQEATGTNSTNANNPKNAATNPDTAK
jgi:uncharacterized membrane protein